MNKTPKNIQKRKEDKTKAPSHLMLFTSLPCSFFFFFFFWVRFLPFVVVFNFICSSIFSTQKGEKKTVFGSSSDPIE